MGAAEEVMIVRVCDPVEQALDMMGLSFKGGVVDFRIGRKGFHAVLTEVRTELNEQTLGRSAVLTLMVTEDIRSLDDE